MLTTVNDVLSACHNLRGNATVRPQWVPGKEPGDHEPGVRLVGVECTHGELILRVELFYLDELEDQEDDA